MGCKDSIIKDVEVIDYPRCWLPTAFTPNNNILNDFYKPVCVNVKRYNLCVFDRWGGKHLDVTVEGDDVYNPILGGWDGNINEEYAPIGVYIAIVIAEDELCNTVTYKMSFTLVR